MKDAKDANSLAERAAAKTDRVFKEFSPFCFPQRILI